MWLYGLRQEQQARLYLQQRGLISVNQNFRSRFGEIDLIMLDRDTLCFIEVKYRSSSRFGGAISSVTVRKQQKIIRTAEFFLTRFPSYQGYRMRFDTVFITRNIDPSEADAVNWIKGAFYAA